MKLRIISLLSFLITLGMQGQELKYNQIQKLESFGIGYKEFITKDPDYGVEFMEILKKEHKRKANKTLGYVFGGLGLLTTTGGILILANIEDNPNNEMDYMDESGAYAAMMGSFVIAMGVGEMGISIPLFVSSKKRKKEMNRMIMKYNPNFKE